MRVPNRKPGLAFIGLLCAAGWLISGALYAQELPTKSMTVNGVSLNYVEEGEGEPVVFVHGGISDHRVFEGQRAAIAEDYQYIAYTRRYYGDQPWPDEGENFGDETHVADLIAFVEGLDRGPVHLVGWSGGGSLAILAALQRPDLLRSMVLYETGGYVAGQLMTTEAGQAAGQEFRDATAPAGDAADAGNLDEAVELFIDAVNNKPGAFAELTEDQQAALLASGRTLVLEAPAPTTPVTCEGMAELDIPTLAIVGEQTWPRFRMVSDKIVECLPDAEKIVLPGARHGAPMAAPQAVNEAILGFLAENGGA